MSSRSSRSRARPISGVEGPGPRARCLPVSLFPGRGRARWSGDVVHTDRRLVDHSVGAHSTVRTSRRTTPSASSLTMWAWSRHPLNASAFCALRPPARLADITQLRVGQSRPSTTTRASSTDHISSAVRLPTRRPSRRASTAPSCSTRTRVVLPATSTSGRNDAGRALREVGATTTTDRGSITSDWTTTPYRSPCCSWPTPLGTLNR